MSKSKDILNEFYLDNSFIFEMSNLFPDDTGIKKGVIWVSSKFDIHRSRVKYYPEGTGDNKPNVSISISSEPTIVAGDKTVIKFKNLEEVYKWVKLNYEKLQYFWDNGYRMNRKEVNNLFDSLEKI